MNLRNGARWEESEWNETLLLPFLILHREASFIYLSTGINKEAKCENEATKIILQACRFLSETKSQLSGRQETHPEHYRIQIESCKNVAFYDEIPFGAYARWRFSKTKPDLKDFYRIFHHEVKLRVFFNLGKIFDP